MTDVRFLLQQFAQHKGYMIDIRTQPNFLHAGDHVHLGPGVTGTRQTNPALDLHELPRIDAVLLSHYHACVATLF